MEVVLSTRATPPRDVPSFVAFGLYEGQSEAPDVLDADARAAVERAAAAGDLSTDVDQELLLLTGEGETRTRTLVIGLGPRGDFDEERMRRVAGQAVRAAEKAKQSTVTLVLPATRRRSLEPARAAVEGALLAAWFFDELKAAPEPGKEPTRVERLEIWSPGGSRGSLNRQIREGMAAAGGANFARTLQSRPGNVATPSHLAEQATEMCEEFGLEVEILDRAALEEAGMKALLSVSHGSAQEPRLIVMRWNGGRAADPPIVLVGKGITFDTGGISLKPSSGMEDMKYDMSGGAGVIGAMRAIAEAKLRANVVGIVPSSENMPSGASTKPGDVIGSYLGKTIEVINTDAEGRLILCDALAYAAEMEPAAIVDCATLTGAVTVALGDQAAALLGTDDKLASELEKAGTRVGERVWRLPLFPEYRQQLDSTVADIKNVGGRKAGTITAAMFLKEFVGEVPWAHLDIAGTAYGEGKLSYQKKGALGVPVRLLFEWVRARSA